MATIYWLGTAPKVAQVQTYLFGGTWEATDYVRVKPYPNGTKTVDFVAGSTTITTIIDSIVTAWNLLSSTEYPEYAEVTASRSSNSLVLTGDTAGLPFSFELTPYETNGDPADAQEIEGAGVATTGTVSTANSGPNDFSVAANFSGGAVPVDNDTLIVENVGSGQEILYGLTPSSLDLTAMIVTETADISIGLPRRHGSGSSAYFEYRATYLTVSTCTTLTIKGGKRVKINVGSNACTCNVYGTGTSPEQGIPSFLFLGTSSSNNLHVLKGSVGVAFFAGETSNLSGTLRLGYVNAKESDANVICGSGVTLDDINKEGGYLEINSNAATFNHSAGESKVVAGAVTTLVMTGGTVRYNSTGTLGTATVAGKGLLDFDQDPRAKAITNPVEVHGKEARVQDSNKVVASLVLDLNYTDIILNGVSIGTNARLTRAAVA